ncbi:MAG: RNA polymerase sigma factor [Gammaproteobacteria bacterium]|nr:RNA polymerase sigma factor [Gammaproteobacteria bacterium]
MLGNISDAEDLVQSSIVKVLSHPSAPKGGVDLQKWLYRVVRNAAIDKLRDQARYQELDETPTIDEQTPEQTLAQQQLKQRLEQALASLPIAQREIVVLRDYHQTSYEEIADILAIAKGTVMSRLHRARLALRQKLLEQQALDPSINQQTQEVSHESLS